jgi:SAM-dependent methyltransferase
VSAGRPDDAVARFDARASDYARYRPSYPAAALDAILADLGDPGSLTVVDVGAGTGISSRLFAARGARVIALEPNPEMRALALASGLDARAGRADATGLPGACADVVASFQAFHWFAHGKAVAEFVRLLRPRGRIALAWNERDDGDAFTLGYGENVDRFADRMALAGFENGPELITRLLAEGGLQRVRRATFANRQRLDYDGLMGRVRSTSYAPREGPAYAAMIEGLRALFERHARDGAIELVYRTDVYLGERAA